MENAANKPAPRLPDGTAGAAGVYVHVPFCLGKCPYCDFYSVAYTEELAARYTEAVLRAIRTHPFGELAADTLYFGGGTPLLLGADRIGRIISAAGEAFSLPAHAEITVEANPAAAIKGTLAGLRAAGVNRISFGVQSLQGGELSALGRLHGPDAARQSILDAAASGFGNISADLVLAVPGQTRESLAASIDGLAALPLSHISAYLLKIEEGTPFGAQKDALPLPDEDAAAQLYLDAVERLGHHGFQQYEISNFARNGAVSRHNCKYWQCAPYLGIGPAAHSCINGGRFFFPRDLEGFLGAEQPFSLAEDDGPGGDAAERLLLGLRLAEGVAADSLGLQAGEQSALLERGRQLERRGLARVGQGRIALTPEGFLLSNSATLFLMEAIDQGCSAADGRSHR